MLGCMGDGNTGVGSGGDECLYGWYAWVRCLSSAGGVLEMSVVRGVGGGCDMCKCLDRGGVVGVGVSG